ncbi:hypothetical protein BCV69DRAFT_164571 [Microstroma glucosiphilum]|uniref:Uncharacterized protein n=1 Tax=Pseudomicrostroma glucosiphilum TaxID=1684307 RepID=A0A316U7P5_9BASI|nr:hypothetical protein BCV69DRAFT_164571 [Pseudomicrostroma glucosiphilum]PWN21259.1 hypothetical protein BCV69DRAFT_164571 [Pseudomicrostroma glucosiphilum]
MTEGGSFPRFRPAVALTAASAASAVTSSHHRRSRLHLRPPPPFTTVDAQEEAAWRRQASFAQLADTISQSWEDLNDYLQSPSVSIAKLHLETLALMRGLHGNRPLDREGVAGGGGGGVRPNAPGGRGGSAGAEKERDAATARLLALASQLNGIRDNLAQVLASSHLMIQAAGDIDLELDFISQFTAKAHPAKESSEAPYTTASAHTKEESPFSSRKRRRTSSPSLTPEDEHGGVVFSPSPSESRQLSLSPAMQPRQISPVPSDRRHAGAGAGAPPAAKSARTDYFGHWNEGAVEEILVSKPRTDDQPATTSLLRQPLAGPASSSASASASATATVSKSTALPSPGKVRRRPHSFHGDDPRSYLTPPPLLKIEEPTRDNLTNEDLTPHRQRWAMLESGPAVPFSPAGG